MAFIKQLISVLYYAICLNVFGAVCIVAIKREAYLFAFIALICMAHNLFKMIELTQTNNNG